MFDKFNANVGFYQRTCSVELLLSHRSLYKLLNALGIFFYNTCDLINIIIWDHDQRQHAQCWPCCYCERRMIVNFMLFRQIECTTYWFHPVSWWMMMRVHSLFEIIISFIFQSNLSYFCWLVSFFCKKKKKKVK